MYGANKYFDGQKLELIHRLGKNIQKFHNNFTGEIKEQVALACIRNFVMLFAMNGGKWGDSWQYQMGVKGMNLKHPRKPGEPHPLISDWIFDDIPPAKDDNRGFQVTEYFGKKALAEDYWENTLENEDEDKLLIVLREYFNWPQLQLQDLWEADDCSIKRVKSFEFLNGNSSFSVSWRNTNAKVLVKLNNSKAMRFQTVIEVVFQNEDTAVLCYGQVWDISEGPVPHKWVDTEYHSLDIIRYDDSETAWVEMEQIQEPIFLIHNCVKMDNQIKNNLPKEIQPTNQYAWVQNMLYYSNRIHEHIALNDECNFDIPCGPKYVCKEHHSTACAECTTVKGKYPNDTWDIEWYCNIDKDSRMFVFDSFNGLAMTLMKPLDTVVQ